MIDKAIAKITKEACELDTPFGYFIEEYLTELCTTTTVAEKLLAEGKSLKAFCNEVTKKAMEEARKVRKGNAGIWGAPDSVFYSQAEEYFGLDKKSSQPDKPVYEKVNVLDLL